MADSGVFERDGGDDLTGIGAVPPSPGDPAQIGPFPVRAVLGAGGMGRVYLGVAPTGYVAVKCILPHLADDADFLRHFRHEMRNQARLPDGVSARLLASDNTARPPWIATEYVPGVTLHDAVFLCGGSLPVADVWKLVHALATQLRPVAELSMVHRDLKPSNVMLTDGGTILIDFGISRAADQSALTTAGKIVGTPAFMAPEQARGRRDLTPAVDVFSLGSALTFAAVGHPPFGEGSGTDLLYRIVHQDPDLGALPGLDPELADLIMSCLAKDPSERPSPAALLDIAAEHVGDESPKWPQAVRETIAARRAFAATAHATPTPLRKPTTAATEAESALERHVPQRVRERRMPRSRKTMAVVLPLVLVVGTVTTLIAMNKVPFATSSQPGAPGTGAQALVSTSATATGRATSALSASPSTPSPGRSGSATASPTQAAAPNPTAGGSKTTAPNGPATTTSPTTRTASQSPTGAPPQPVTGMHSQPIYAEPYKQTIPVGWNPQPDATSFDVHYTNSGSDTYQDPSVDKIINTTDTSYTITAYPGETFCIWLRARNQFGVSAWGTDGGHCFTV